jgi:negative regulator of flagellin synthesis FlgM
MTQTTGIGNNSQLIGTSLNQTEKTAQTDRAKATAENATKQAPSTAQSGTTATLSGTGSMLAAAASGTDDVRMEKVAALKSAIDSGTYNVSADKVADKLIDNMLG